MPPTRHTNTPLRGYTNLGNFCYNYRLMNKGLIYPDECYAIRRAIYEVYDEIGSGFREAMGFVIPFVKIRVPRRRHSCRGHQTQTEGRGGTETTCEGRLGDWVSCEWGEWRSWQVAFKQRRLRAVSRGQGARLMRRVSWSRVSANLPAHMEQYICEIAAMLTYRVFVHKSLGTPRRCALMEETLKLWYNVGHETNDRNCRARFCPWLSRFGIGV